MMMLPLRIRLRISTAQHVWTCSSIAAAPKVTLTAGDAKQWFLGPTRVHTPKRHLDRFSRFCRARTRGHADTPTDHACVTSHIFCYALQCGLIIHSFISPQNVIAKKNKKQNLTKQNKNDYRNSLSLQFVLCIFTKIQSRLLQA